MKKVIYILLTIIMTVVMVVGCREDEKATSDEIQKGTTDLAEDTEKELEESATISGDFDEDVQAGLFYADPDTLKIVDEDGNPIKEYDSIFLNDQHSLADEYGILEGYWVEDDWKITINQAYIDAAEENNNNTTTTGYQDTLLSIADSSVKGRDIQFTEVDDNGYYDPYCYIASDRSAYYSDIIYGNWWQNHQVNGTPLAGGLAEDGRAVQVNIPLDIDTIDIDASGILENFRFIDQTTYTTDQLKRESPEHYLYGFYCQNIQKDVDEHGQQYFTGYIDTEYVAVYGNFDRLLNGDGVFVYAAYNGLNINDVPIFDGGYIEYVN